MITIRVPSPMYMRHSFVRGERPSNRSRSTPWVPPAIGRGNREVPTARWGRRLPGTLGRDFDVAVRWIDSTPVVTPTGELDLASAPAFRTAISETMAHHPEHVVVDLLGITFMDSSGIGALVSAKQDNPGTELTLVVGGGVVQKLIDITGLKDWFRIEGDVETALNRSGAQPSSNA